jgi:thioesterase domain-containing protein
MLDAERPFYGLQSEEVTPEDFPTIEVMAHRYVEAIREIDAEGPYMLGGYSSGGVVALEMAQQLLAAGRKVAALVMLDSRFPGGTRTTRASGLRVADMFRNIPYWLLDDALRADRREIVARLRAKMRLVWARLGGLRGRRHPVRPDIRDVLGLWQVPDWRREWLEAHHRALQNYHPGRYPGPIVVVRARAGALLSSGSPDLGWSQVAARGTEVHRVPGTHGNLLLEPFVGAVARELARCLDRAEAPPPSQAAKCPADERPHVGVLAA